MSEFKTVGPTRFGVGDGATRKFSVGRPGDVVQSANIESVRKVGWQGDVLLSPRPRTNLVLFSNDFNNTAWKGSPSLYADFTTGNMPPGIDFSRASTATYWGADGVLREADVDEPRFDYDPLTGEALGLLRERSRTQLNKNTNASWNIHPSSIGLNISTNSSSKFPAGVAVTKISGSLGNDSNTQTNQIGSEDLIPIVDARLDHTTGFFIRAPSDIRYLGMQSGEITDNTENEWALFDFQTKNIIRSGFRTRNATSKDVGGGWFYFSYESTNLPSVKLNISIILGKGNDPDPSTWKGLTELDWVEVALPMKFLGYGESSPIITTGAQATRAADIITYANADNSPLFPNGEFSAVIDYDATALTPSADRITAYFNGTTPLSVKDANTLDGYGNALPSLGYQAGRNKVSFAVNANRKSGSRNGGTTVESLGATAGVNSTTQVNFSQGGVAQNYNGHLRSFQLYNRALPDTTLQELSSL